MKDFLLDTFRAEGDSLSELKELLDEIEKRTAFVKVYSSDLQLLSFTKSDEEKLFFLRFDPKGIFGLSPHVSLTKSHILKKGDFESVIKETENETKLMFFDGSKSYFVSDSFTKTLDQFGLKGQFLSEPCHERDQMIAKRFANNRECTIVMKTDKGGRKAFALLGKNYVHVPQSVLLDVVNQLNDTGVMGKLVCKRWEVNHFYTSVYVEFPEKADEFQRLYGLDRPVIPGLLLTTSDTGDSSLSIRGTWRVGNSLSLHREIRRKHIGKVEIDKILDECDKSIFSEYTKLPETLCDLMSKDITDASWDLATTSGQKLNCEAVRGAVKKAFKQLGIVKAIGKKAEMALYEQVCAEFDSSIPVTAYDIAISLLGMSDRVIGLKKSTKDALAEAMAGAPYISYDNDPAIILA